MYVIRNYGNSRELPYKGKVIFIARDGAIETNDSEMAQALSGQPMITVTLQPGTAGPTVPVPNPPEPGESDDDDNDDDNQGENEDGDDDENAAAAPDEEAQKPDYESMTKRELLAAAAEQKLEIPEQNTKRELIELLSAPSKEDAEDAE